MSEKIYILYDSRANFKNTEDCSIVCVADSFEEVINDSEEVINDSKDNPEEYIWFSYDRNGEELNNEQRLATCEEIVLGKVSDL